MAAADSSAPLLLRVLVVGTLVNTTDAAALLPHLPALIAPLAAALETDPIATSGTPAPFAPRLVGLCAAAQAPTACAPFHGRARASRSWRRLRHSRPAPALFAPHLRTLPLWAAHVYPRDATFDTRHRAALCSEHGGGRQAAQ
jgi:hypothetical protein